jgi:hypothetical protein
VAKRRRELLPTRIPIQPIRNLHIHLGVGGAGRLSSRPTGSRRWADPGDLSTTSTALLSSSTAHRRCSNSSRTTAATRRVRPDLPSLADSLGRRVRLRRRWRTPLGCTHGGCWAHSVIRPGGTHRTTFCVASRLGRLGRVRRATGRSMLCAACPRAATAESSHQRRPSLLFSHGVRMRVQSFR